MNQFRHGHALLIGVGGDLPVTVKDATDLRDLLINPSFAGYPPNQVELLTGPSATRSNIIAAFRQLSARAQPDPQACVIVYYSGHGAKIEQGGEHRYFLVPTGFDQNDLANTSIAGDELMAELDVIKSRILLVLLDCCHAAGVAGAKSAAMIQSAAPPKALVDLLQSATGRVVLSSSTSSEYSYVADSRSIFTDCLLAALTGEASPDGDDAIRVLDVVQHVLKEVPKRAKPREQHPFVNEIKNMSENFVVGLRAAKSAAVGPQPKQPKQPSASTLKRLDAQIETIDQALSDAAPQLTRLRHERGQNPSILQREEIDRRIEAIESECTRSRTERAQLVRKRKKASG